MTADGAADAEMSPRGVHADEHAGAMYMDHDHYATRSLLPT